MPRTRTIVLVSCVKSKRTRTSKAKDLYESTLFKAQRAFAETFGDRWFILSAKYGLVDPEREIELYEETLKGAPVGRKRKWSTEVFAQLKPLIKDGDNVIVTAGEDYCRYLVPMIRSLGNEVTRPVQGLSMGFIPGRLYNLIESGIGIDPSIELEQQSRKQRTLAPSAPNRSASNAPSRKIDAFYSCIERLSRITGGSQYFQAISSSTTPKRGVYFVFEDGELRADRGAQRVVRIGTHGLHAGSKSSLYGRLRNHKGTAAGSGNHRGSVFRLHIGKAIMKRDSIACPTWARKSSAPPEVVAIEQPLEQKVSDYIRRMKVLLLNIADEPGPESLRGFIERNSIGLLAAQEPASKDWLGFDTDNAAIVKSHLWNVNHVDYEVDSDFFDCLSRLIAEQERLGLLSPGLAEKRQFQG